MDYLLMIERGHLVIDAIFFRHPFRHEKRTGYRIKENQLSREVLVIGIALMGMVPMVKLRRRENPFEGANGNTAIGMDDQRLPFVDDGKNADSHARESERKDGEIGRGFRQNLIQRVNPVRGEPIHLLNTVMHAVELP